ncbi:zona pellucida sperm-binding protein 3 isoform X1 [Alligator mississippiensis]|uniref:zona pellucida sperm-binding protein 3 isoform X1 n=1 Tax=Alligator mississippiensis TaxID=8496 RepID=UPI0028774E04|nr:zona pellucida sperm-binding protein 3 isoform X1 [Alligator mississippiensis]
MEAPCGSWVLSFLVTVACVQATLGKLGEQRVWVGENSLPTFCLLTLFVWEEGTLDDRGCLVFCSFLWVSVACGNFRILITVLIDLFGNGVHVAANELTLGASCAVTAVQPDRFQLNYPLSACGATMELLPDSIRYRNILYYRPSAVGGVIRASPFSLLIDCLYPRTGNVSTLGLQPTWVPFSSTVIHRQRLDFALDIYDSTWSSPLSDPSYHFGDLINIQASVKTDSHVPLKIYVDECVAQPIVESSMKYKIITNYGCFVDAEHSRSRFLAPQRDNFLRFQLDPFLFTGAPNNQIYLFCHLKAVAPGPANAQNKACSYDGTAAAWHSQEGGDCSCCASPVGCGSRRRHRHALHKREGLLDEADIQLGPFQLASIVSSSPVTFSSSSMKIASTESTSAILETLTLASTIPSTPDATNPILFSPQQPVNPIVREEAKETSGLHLPFSVTTLTIAVMSCFFVFLGILGCYCSMRHYQRGYPMGAADAAPTESGAVAMAPTASGDPKAASGKDDAGVAASCGNSRCV